MFLFTPSECDLEFLARKNVDAIEACNRFRFRIVKCARTKNVRTRNRVHNFSMHNPIN